MKRAVIIGLAVPLFAAVLVGASFTAYEAVAQEDEEEEAGYLNDYIEALRQDVRTNKRDLISWNMELTAKESAAFWPVYRKYEYDLASVNNEMVSLVKEYATKGGMLSEDDAGRMLQRRFDLEQRRLDMKKRYVGEFRKALPGHKVVRFYQLDRAIDMLIDIAVMSEIPLATGEE